MEINKINYSEFIAASIEIKEILSERKLKILFKEFDVDNSGGISAENLNEAFTHKLHKKLTLDQIDEIYTKHDTGKDGLISFDEFKVMLVGETDSTTSSSCSSTDEIIDKFYTQDPQ